MFNNTKALYEYDLDSDFENTSHWVLEGEEETNMLTKKKIIPPLTLVVVVAVVKKNRWGFQSNQTYGY